MITWFLFGFISALVLTGITIITSGSVQGLLLGFCLSRRLSLLPLEEACELATWVINFSLSILKHREDASKP